MLLEGFDLPGTALFKGAECHLRRAHEACWGAPLGLNSS